MIWVEGVVLDEHLDGIDEAESKLAFARALSGAVHHPKTVPLHER